jgi:methylphosphotriester-DNA--protein-cysteine methyltransferase
LPICATSAGNYVASKNSDVFHIASCHYVDRIYDSNKIWFNTISQAEASGRRGCYVCKPGSSDTKSNKKSSTTYDYSNYKTAVENAKTGYNTGYEEGKKAGYDEGYKKGKAEEKTRYETELKAEINKTRMSTAAVTCAVTSCFCWLFKKD